MMTRSDIMLNSLEQLTERFHSNPESFEYVESEHSTSIMWQTKLNINDKLVADPTSYQRTILVTWSDLEKSLSLYIFNETFDSPDRLFNGAVKYDAKLSLKRIFERYRTPYRKFTHLISLAKQQREHRKTKDFLNKMSSVFPAMLDHFILGK